MQYQYSRVYTPTKVVNNQGHCTSYHMVPQLEYKVERVGRLVDHVT